MDILRTARAFSASLSVDLTIGKDGIAQYPGDLSPISAPNEKEEVDGVQSSVVLEGEGRSKKYRGNRIVGNRHTNICRLPSIVVH
ncbi:predicted protein [Sclerotinia sclerotiorum 1980 UF-70]|uniref:Uncharacterized protein n=1 Tax=Sclerotinia sclerotiorum (strain ATCC 18683 / 1980 / Ss-1) TaxID=665079 RepID=A7E4J4_SCLS1|nr:predicted protein [Sclerotinia sclerotiorum 1980 UF-70]EDN90816.1 predicted protein [Sclerotinia sclerotiorum 1980 UF-70]